MIQAQHTWLFTNFFNWYAAFIAKRHFSRLHIIGNYTPNNKAILLVSNHFSWWDGFLVYILNQQVFKKKFHAMMLYEQLKLREFSSKAGAFSIQPGSASALETIKYTNTLLLEKNNLVALFPQGSFESMHQFPLHFKKGWERLLFNNQESFTLMFSVILIDYFASRKPICNIYFEEYAGNIEGIETAFNKFYKQCISKQKE